MATMQRKQMNLEEIWNSNKDMIRKLLTYMSEKDLLLLSLVSMTWNFEAKSLLQRRGTTVAKIGQNITRSSNITSPVAFEASNVLSISEGPQFYINTSHLNGRAGKVFHSVQTRWAIVTKFGAGAVIASETQRPLGMPTDTASKLGTTPACHDMVSFERILSEMRGVIPFSGMSIKLDLGHDGPCASACHESLMDEIGSRFPLKTVRLELKRNERNADGACRAQGLIPPLLTSHAHQLEEISLVVPNSFLDLDAIFSARRFSRLRILKCNFFGGNDPLRPTTLRSFAETAPNLEEFHLIGLESPGASVAVLTERLRSVLGYFIDQRRVFLVCQKSINQSPDIPAECVKQIAYSSVGMQERFWENPRDENATTKILLNSQRTLKEAELNLLQVAKALRTGARLKKLDTLDLYFFAGWEQVYPELTAATMCQEAWDRCFPNLKTLSLFQADNPIVSRPQADELINALHIVSGSARGEKAALRITKLIVPGHNYSLSAIELAMILNVCQNVKSLFLVDLNASLNSDRIPSLPDLLSRLSCIENVESNGFCDGEAVRNFDSLFCGVHEDEADELRRKSVEYLKAVHIVPIQTPITHSKHLKSLVFHERAGPVRAGSSFVVSKVSAAICFSRMPDTTIELNSPATFPYGPTKTQRVFLDIMKKFPEIKMKTRQLITN